MDVIIEKYGLTTSLSMALINRFSFLPSIAAVSLFVIFLNIKFCNRNLNYIAQSVLSVYLISEHPYLYTWLWKTCFDNMEFYSYYYMIPVAILQSIIVMIGCFSIDMLYRIARDTIMKRVTA